MVSKDNLIAYAMGQPGGFTVGDVTNDLEWPLDLAIDLIDEALRDGAITELLVSPVGPVYVIDWERVPVRVLDWPA